MDRNTMTESQQYLAITLSIRLFCQQVGYPAIRELAFTKSIFEGLFANEYETCMIYPPQR